MTAPQVDTNAFRLSDLAFRVGEIPGYLAAGAWCRAIPIRRNRRESRTTNAIRAGCRSSDPTSPPWLAARKGLCLQ
jgi:hypothetical protein